MPQFQVAGQKSVLYQEVHRVYKAINNDKLHKLRDGHDLTSLLSEEKKCGVYPWPSQTNDPLINAQSAMEKRAKRNAHHTELQTKRNEEGLVRVEYEAPCNSGSALSDESNPLKRRKTKTSFDEEKEAAEKSIDEIAANNDAPEGSSAEPLSDPKVSIDTDAFEAMRQKVLRGLGALPGNCSSVTSEFIRYWQGAPRDQKVVVKLFTELILMAFYF